VKCAEIFRPGELLRFCVLKCLELLGYWGFILFCKRLNGRPQGRKGHFLSSTPYSSEIIEFSAVPACKNPIVLQQNYIENGLTVKQMSVLHGCGETVIKKHLKQFGIRKTEVMKCRSKTNLSFGEKLKSGKVLEHKTEANIKKAIIDMYTKEGLSVTAIARVLTQMKVPTKKRGKKWDHSVVTAILKRESVYQPKRPPRGK